MTPAEFIKWREALGGRRFLLTLGAGVVFTALRINDLLDQTIFRDLLLGTVGTYIAARAYIEVKDRGNKTPVDRVDSPDPGAGRTGR